MKEIFEVIIYAMLLQIKIPFVVCGYIYSDIHNGVRAYIVDNFISTFYNASLLDESYEMNYNVAALEV